ncbi:MAG: PAS domain-containing protein [Gammaproteobacteria bacterium]|nr:PAS domain-containing protein [Gammaproteobacteria bacterium]MDE2250615.1 PAS domain-containing protein [Gammaproteobacteria bacterium]
MQRTTDKLVALQFLAVILPVTLVLLGQFTADARRAGALEQSRPLRNLASEARSNYRTFTNGAADAVDTGTLGRQSAEALRTAAAQLAELRAQLQPRGGDAVLGDTPQLVAALSGRIRNGAQLATLLPLRADILRADQQTRALDDYFVRRDQAVVRDAIDSAATEKRLVIGALFVSGALTVCFVLATRRRLRQQLEAEAAIERRRRAELETISIRFGAASKAARAGVYELQQQGGQVWWSETMHELYGQRPGEFRPTLQSWLQLIHPDDRAAAAQAMNTALGEGRQLRTQYRVALADGSTRHIESLAAIVVDSTNACPRLVGIDLDVTERIAAQQREAQLQQQLRDASRHAGMAEVAASVLHNVGNVLNSVNVSASLVSDRLRKSKAAGLSRVVALLQEHQADLADFVGRDARGRHLPAYLEQLAVQLLGERDLTLQELDALRANIEHIKEVVAMQQSHARLAGVAETIDLRALVEEGLRLDASGLERQAIALQRQFSEVPPITVDKHRVLQILVNLLRNAKHACQAAGRSDSCISVRVGRHAAGVRIAVADNGVGIAPENLTRIFSHGFTTKRNGHGFGLHSGALAARELGGALRVESAGPGQGATFYLDLPLQPQGACA